MAINWNFPKYLICKVRRDGVDKWSVNKGRKELSIHDDQAAAESEVQRLVEDDRWNAANR
jgi:hypothetical protein